MPEQPSAAQTRALKLTLLAPAAGAARARSGDSVDAMCIGGGCSRSKRPNTRMVLGRQETGSKGRYSPAGITSGQR